MLKSCGKTQVLCVKCAKNTEHWHERSIRWVDKTYVLVLLFGCFGGAQMNAQWKHLKSFVILAVNAYKSSCLHISTKKIPYGTWKLRTKNHTSTCIQWTVRVWRLAFDEHSQIKTNKTKSLICITCMQTEIGWVQIELAEHAHIVFVNIQHIEMEHQTLNGMGKWKSLSWNVFATAEEVRWSVKIDTLKIHTLTHIDHRI